MHAMRHQSSCLCQSTLRIAWPKNLPKFASQVQFLICARTAKHRSRLNTKMEFQFACQPCSFQLSTQTELRATPSFVQTSSSRSFVRSFQHSSRTTSTRCTSTQQASSLRVGHMPTPDSPVAKLLWIHTVVWVDMVVAHSVEKIHQRLTARLPMQRVG